MSTADVVTFLDRLDNERELSHRLMSVPPSTANVIRLANELGYHFTAEEFRAGVLHRNSPADELSDAEIDTMHVAGSAGTEAWKAYLYRTLFAGKS
ncbi:MAG TPA: Nif11-like leader peptide family natural product precursor [Aggregatilineales bacterium]|nr:Nif11-like leader peptide family natural product precursor [Aggregatilineales bacterium]